MKYKTTLEEVFNTTGRLTCNLLASSLLIDKLEVYGYVADKRDIQPWLDNMINLDGSNRIVCSDRIYQVQHKMEKSCYGPVLKSTGITIPIFKSVEKKDEEMQFPLKQVYVPSLVSNPLYIDIRSRKKDGIYKVDQYKLTRNKMPDNIIIVDNEAFYKKLNGEFVCKDKYGSIKGVCDYFMAVCRYICPKTGSVNYTILSLDELYVELNTNFDI